MPLGRGQGGHGSPLQFPKQLRSTSFSLKHQRYGCSEIIRTRNFTIFSVYTTIFFKLRVALREIDHFTLELLKSLTLWAIRKKTTMNKSLNARLYAESWNYWQSPLKQKKHPYNFTISIDTGPSQNIFWSNSNIQMWSTSRDWKTGYVIKTGPTEKLL